MPTFKTSLLVVRGQDDQVRVFHIACRHRGNKLVREGEGCRKSFMCNFHGWIFSCWSPPSSSAPRAAWAA